MLIENKYYFTHIPRTGGRYIESLFLKNNYVCNFNNYDLFLRDFLKRKNIEVAHFEYPYYLTFCIVTALSLRFESVWAFLNT